MIAGELLLFLFEVWRRGMPSLAGGPPEGPEDPGRGVSAGARPESLRLSLIRRGRGAWLGGVSVAVHFFSGQQARESQTLVGRVRFFLCSQDDGQPGIDTHVFFEGSAGFCFPRQEVHDCSPLFEGGSAY